MWQYLCHIGGFLSYRDEGSWWLVLVHLQVVVKEDSGQQVVVQNIYLIVVYEVYEMMWEKTNHPRLHEEDEVKLSQVQMLWKENRFIKSHITTHKEIFCLRILNFITFFSVGYPTNIPLSERGSNLCVGWNNGIT